MSEERLNSKSITVLGGLGFIGSHVCRALVKEGHSVRAFSRENSSTELVGDIQEKLVIVKGDVTCPQDVLKAIDGSDVVIHLIHTTVPGSSMVSPTFDISSNVAATAEWASRLDKANIRRIIYVSSGGTIYGLPQTGKITETHPVNPISSYGITKLANEKYISMYASMFGIESFILRPSNVYGDGQRLGKGQGVVGVLTSRALNGEPLEVWGSGQSLRDYLYIDDLVSAILKMITYNGTHKLLNVSSGKGHSVLDIIALLQEILGTVPEVRHISARGFDVPVNVLDATLLETETGWHARTSLAEGLRLVVQSMQNR